MNTWTGQQYAVCCRWVQVRPGLSVTHPIRHPAVDPSGRVSSQGLQQWSAQSTLAAVVAETISLLTGSAPPPQARLGSPSGELHSLVRWLFAPDPDPVVTVPDVNAFCSMT